MTDRLTLIDSSAFIEFSHHAGSEVAEAVDTALAEGRAAVCTVVAAELLTRCRTTAEYRRMELLLAALTWLPLTDRLVVVTARLHEVELLHHDAHFDLIGDTPDTVQ